MNISYKNILLGVSFTFFGYIFGITESSGYISYLQNFHVDSGTAMSGIISSEEVFNSSKVHEAFKDIEQNYYGFHSKDKKTVEDAFLSSLANSLGDKHSSYFNQTDATKFVNTLNGDFEGIGAVIHENVKGIQIMKVLPGSPAEKGKLVAGDIITHVDGKSMIGITADEAVNLIRGPKGSTVELTILHNTKDKEIESKVVVKRDTVVVPTVYSETFTGSNLGYIQVSIFGGDTVSEFTKAFNTLTSSGVNGIIIDARDNGGGFLEAAVDILSIMLPKNTITVSTKGNNPLENMTLYTKDGVKSNTSIPIVMLVNNMSASATEITAGALQEHGRALIVGEKTYGKGSVQTPFTLSDGSILKLTTAKWYTPNGRSIDEKGIEPDVMITLTDEDYKNRNDRQLEGAKKLLELQIKKKLTIEALKKEAITLTF